MDNVKPDIIDTAQVPFELERLLAIFGELDPPNGVLEIGVWHGGTLWHWLQGGHEVVAVDDEMRDADAWEEWALEAGSSLDLIQGDSHDPAVVEQVRAFGAFDFVFIDAGHTYADVSVDWQNFREMVAPGGVVAFHDILPRPDYGVDQLWSEIKAEGLPTVEIVEGSRPGYCGIGVVWLP